MPTRTTPLITGEYYHVFNRGISHQFTYKNKKDYERFLRCLDYYRFFQTPVRLARLLQLPIEERKQIIDTLKKENNKIVTIHSFALMPNHFHLLIKQEKENGISSFLKHVSDAYTRYFNTKHNRYGPLYQGAFKAVRIETDEQLLHVSRYIHLNPVTGYVVKEKDFLIYPWSSLKYYLNMGDGFVETRQILKHFSDNQQYRQFVLDQINYGKELEKMKHLIFEE